MHLSLEQDFDVSWGSSQGLVTFTVSGEVTLAEEPTVAGLQAGGFYEHPMTGRDVRFGLSDLTESQRMTCEEALLEEAERRERWSQRAAAAADTGTTGTTWRQR